MTGMIAPPKPAFRDALRFWSKLGWISFGGTAAHIAIMHEVLVEQKKWISNSRFLHALSHCMLLPGPEAQQLAIYIGWKLHGKKGGLAAGILFVLPSMFILLALSVLYVRFGNMPLISSMFSGLKPAVIALIIVALFRIGQRALRGPLHYIVAASAFTAMFFFGVSLVPIMAATIALGVVLGMISPSLLHLRKSADEDQDESEYFLNRYTKSPASRGSRSLLRLVASGLLIWTIPLALLYVFANDFSFWAALVLFFTKSAFVTVGGSYTVIPYVAQITVAKFHWLTKPQMMDGFALAETTPGPLIIVVAFVGFMAGYNHFHHSLWMGTVALLATTLYTFLPCFIFVFGGAPLIEHTQNKPAIEGTLGLITAVVVGAILDLTLFLGKSVIFPGDAVTFRQIDGIAVLWIALALVLLKKFNLNVIYLIVLSLAFGALRHWFG
jgi:chromate transporter